MKIKRRHDRHVRPHDSAHTSRNLALAIIQMLGDHSPVQIEKHTVEWPGVANTSNDLISNLLKRIAGHMRRWDRTGPKNRYHVPTLRGGHG